MSKRKKNPALAAPLTGVPDPSKQIRWAAAAAFLLVALHFHFLFVFPSVFDAPAFFGRTWGFDFIRFYSRPWQVLFYAAALALCIPSVNKWVSIKAAGLLNALSRSALRNRKRLLFIAIALLSVPVFILLTSKYAFLGDSHLRSGDAVAGTIRREQFLSLLVFHWCYELFRGIQGFDGVAAIKLCAWAAGGVFVYFSLKMADELGKNIAAKTAIFVCLAAGGYMEQFCGYVEEYAFGLVFVVIYFYTAVLALRGKTHVGVPILVAAIGAVFHFGLLLYMPSCAVLIYFIHLKDRPIFKKASFWVVFSVAGSVLFYFFAYKPMEPRLYPIFDSPGETRMIMFSLRHCWEYFNSLCLSSGPAVILFPLCILAAAKRRVRLDGISLFMILTALPPLAGFFILNNFLGSRDWDIFSFAAIALNLATVHFLTGPLNEDRQTAAPRTYTVAVLCGFMILHTLFWIILCASDRSIARLEDAVLDDPAIYYTDHPAPMVLGIVLSTNKLEDRAMAMYELAYRQYPDDPRNAFNYAAHLAQQDRVKEALPLLEELFNRFPEYPLPLRLLYQISLATGNDKTAVEVLKRIYGIAAQSPEKLSPYLSREETVQLLTQLERYYENGESREAEKVRAVIKSLAGVQK